MSDTYEQLRQELYPLTNYDAMTTQEILDRASKIQQQDLDSLSKSLAIIEDSKALAAGKKKPNVKVM